MNAATSVTNIPEWKKIQSAFAANGLRHVFLELLGWSAGVGSVIPVTVDGELYSPTILAELKGYKIFLIETGQLPPPKTQAKLDTELSAQAPEKITIISDGKNLQWRWPHQTPNGGVSFETLSISATAMPSFLAQRLVGLRFVAQDFARGLSIVDVRDRVRGRFDGAKVTKKFFDEFRKRHQHLADNIQGLEVEVDRSAYATLLMNRLMLLYFLQKREFLNDDPQYLENCLKGVESLQGKNKFYSFYRDLLLPMFFDRLASFDQKELPSEISNIIGDIPYINGGIYEPSPLEKDHADDLNVPDEVFDEILTFFGRFNWHLDTRPSGSENEINPEVIGYIFEQYINYTAGGKKDNGAYYTKEDVTGYMVGATLVPRVLDDLVELAIPFDDLVASDPMRYIYADMLHGFDHESGSWLAAPVDLVKVWLDDPIHWHALDNSEANTEINLPGETWVETFYRRERVEKLVAELGNGSVREVNDLITLNLNARLLLTDAIDRIESPDSAVALWERVTALTVLDPTCGSGAFLFAAMEALEDVYHHLIDLMKSGAVSSAKAGAIVEEASRHPNDRYFVRKAIALNNLYGTDIMPDAIETAQLRIFLALVSCLENKNEIEPLPDLNFNLKCGNLVVGLYDLADLERFGADLLSRLALEELTPVIDDYKVKFATFVESSKSGDLEESSAAKASLRVLTEQLRRKADLTFAGISGVADESVDEWCEKFRPFHWFIEFPGVIHGGGFDVIVGNPPYIARKNLSAEELRLIDTFETWRCPDFYSVCFERSLSLLHNETGRHALVVMLNLAFSGDFSALRETISKQSDCEWWSTFGKRPDALFAGVQVRNTIVVLARKGSRKEGFGTKHQLFTKKSRKWLFQATEYRPLNRGPSLTVVRAGIASPLVMACEGLPAPFGPPGVDSLYLKPTGQYWFPVLLRPPPVLAKDGGYIFERDPGLKELALLESESAVIVGAALAGKVGYLWWSATGDDFHVNLREAEFARKLLRSMANQDELSALAADVWNAGLEQGFVSENKGGYVNIRWSAARSATDLFDREFLDRVGLIEHWRALNIWYRQSMLSEKPNSNSRDLTPEEAIAYLGPN